MDIRKRVGKIGSEAGLDKITLESVLGMVGLRLARPRSMFPIVAAFGAGVALAGGVAFLLASPRGKALRNEVMRLAKPKAKNSDSPMVDQGANDSAPAADAMPKRRAPGNDHMKNQP